jgi:serine/threonine-protein kinase
MGPRGDMSVSLEEGSLFADRFELISCLGEGGAGTVWKARDQRRGILVALKVLRWALTNDAEQRRAFAREAELCARMMSPHFVRMLSFGLDAWDAPFIVYEMLEGEPLDARLRRDARLLIDDAEAVVVQIARALARAHSMDIVHKDIKPANVFLTRDEQGRPLAKVLDFGIAEVVSRPQSAEIDLAGTLGYMAPEVLLDGKQADTRADLYSLTALAYECLSGRPAFHGPVLDILTAMEAPVPSLAPLFPEEAAKPLDAWVAKGLARDPDRRFQSARELAVALHEAIKESKNALVPTSRRAVSTFARDRRPSFEFEAASLESGSVPVAAGFSEVNASERSKDTRSA